MIYLDTTKSGDASHRSGLTRVTQRLAAALGSAARPARWDERRSGFVAEDGARPERNDWILTAELFSEEERPGLSAFLARRSCRLAAIFHDAIPLRFPHTTWPRSVARHPGYLKLLGGFDRVWAVSRASAGDLTGYWHWLGLELRPRRLREAAMLWQLLREQRDIAGRDAVWAHPDLLPSSDDLEDPAAFVGND